MGRENISNREITIDHKNNLDNETLLENGSGLNEEDLNSNSAIDSLTNDRESTLDDSAIAFDPDDAQFADDQDTISEEEEKDEAKKGLCMEKRHLIEDCLEDRLLQKELGDDYDSFDLDDDDI